MLTTSSATKPTRRSVDGQIVDPAAMTVVADHDAPNHLAVFLEDHEIVSVMDLLALDVSVGIVPTPSKCA